MISGLLGTTNVPALEEVLRFAHTRHELLAGNVANMDTPGYQIRDLSPTEFQARLKEAIEDQQRTAQAPLLGNPNDIDDTDLREVNDSMKHIMFHDGSDLSLEHQVTEMSKNQFLHNMAIQIMASQFRQLQAAISERV